MDAVADAADRWDITEPAELPWAGGRWIAVPEDSSRATHAVDVSDIGDTAVRSRAGREQCQRALGVDEAGPNATARLDTLSEQVAASYDSVRGVAFELLPGPAAQT
jgi:hypothetical protein